MIEGNRLIIRKLVPGDVNEIYLGWLNDQELQKYTRRRGKTTTMQDLQKFVEDSQYSKDYFFAMIEKETNKHIGNIFLNLVDDENKNADLSIMIGDTVSQKKGYAQEAIHLIVDFAFHELCLHRLYACSPNPAFNRMIMKAGWKHEGTHAQAFYLDGEFRDIECWAMLTIL